MIRIETSDYLDVGRLRLVSGPIFPETNRGKLGVTLNFRSPEGLRYALRNEANEPRAEELVTELQRRAEA